MNETLLNENNKLLTSLDIQDSELKDSFFYMGLEIPLKDSAPAIQLVRQ
jgi:hypothetical protein